MPEPQHRLTQVFRSAELEAAYLESSARTVRRAYRILTVLGLLGFTGAWFADASAVRTAANVAAMHSTRLLAYPILFAIVAFGYAPAGWFQRGWRWVFMLGVVALLDFPMLGYARMPDPTQVDLVVAYIGVISMMVAAGVMLPLGVVQVALLVAAIAVPLVVLAVSWPVYQGTAVLWIGLAALTELVAAYQLNGRDRAAFAATYRLDAERARSERLLRNILPAPIAERLKGGHTRIADSFAEATVLFADIVGFTTLAQRLPAEDVVAALDEVFSAFDDIAARHGLEKIKTIGDAYMVVGGVPTARADHAVAVASMALEMRELVAARRFGGHQLELRIGIHTGPVVAGVIGKQKFIYDLWGDTVNTASRMESHGLPSGIQVTAEMQTKLAAGFELEARGAVAIKGKGELPTWLLLGKRAEVRPS